MPGHPEIIARALTRLLTPLVRILLRYGVSCGAVTDLLRRVYVTVAERDFAVPGRKQSTSRIAVLTGLHRKEVARLRQLETDEPDALDERYNRAARVMSGWLRDPDFRDAAGRPADLPLDTPSGFPELVRRYSGDMTMRTVLDELERVGAVARTDDGFVTAVEHGYVPAHDDSDKLHILGTDTRDLIATIDHNLSHPPGSARFQRKVAYDNVPPEHVEAFRAYAAERAQALLEELDAWLAARDRDTTPASKQDDRRQVRLGLGIHQIEEWPEPGHRGENS